MKISYTNHKGGFENWNDGLMTQFRWRIMRKKVRSLFFFLALYESSILSTGSTVYSLRIRTVVLTQKVCDRWVNRIYTVVSEVVLPVLFQTLYKITHLFCLTLIKLLFSEFVHFRRQSFHTRRLYFVFLFVRDGKY